MPCYVKVRLQVDPLVSSSDLGEDPQQVPRDPLGTAFGGRAGLRDSLLSWLLLAQQGKFSCLHVCWIWGGGD